MQCMIKMYYILLQLVLLCLDQSLFWALPNKKICLLIVCSNAIESKPVKLDTNGQSYKQFTIVIYDSRGVLTVKLLIL